MYFATSKFWLGITHWSWLTALDCNWAIPNAGEGGALVAREGNRLNRLPTQSLSFNLKCFQSNINAELPPQQYGVVQL